MSEPQTAEQRADLRWALERVKMFDSSKLMPYQEGMIAMADEIERLLELIRWAYRLSEEALFRRNSKEDRENRDRALSEINQRFKGFK